MMEYAPYIGAVAALIAGLFLYVLWKVRKRRNNFNRNWTLPPPGDPYYRRTEIHLTDGTTPDGYFEFNRKELAAEFARAQELPQGREEQLGYDDMLALADVFEGWALDSRGSGRNGHLAGAVP
jgi:hypothetical protein